MAGIENNPYGAFFNDIKEKIYRAQYEAMKQVNQTLLKLYWEIGKSIVEKQDEYGLGEICCGNLIKRPAK